MITQLRISNLGIISHSELEFGTGLIALTGETGAGKTMLVGALGLVLGDRADFGLVGEQDAHVELRMAADDATGTIADEAGADLDDGELLIGRTLTASGRSRAYLGGRSVPAAVLQQLAEAAVNRHSQHDQVEMRKPARQRQALDRYGGAALQEALAAYRALYERYAELSQEVAQWQRQQRELASEAELLQHGLNQIDAVGPNDSDDTDLDVEIARLERSDQLRDSTLEARSLLSTDEEDGDTRSLLLRAEAALRVGEGDPELRRIAATLRSASEIVEEAARDLRAFGEGLDAEPERLAQLQSRKAALAELRRRYGASVAEINAWAEQARSRLATLDPDGNGLHQRRQELAALATELSDAALQLSQLREHAAVALGSEVTAELQELAMPHARLLVRVSQQEDSHGLQVADGRRVAFGEQGIDKVQFLLQSHAGSQATPLGDGASGGEMSRILLALQVVLAATSDPRVYVFDEIDAGIGGQTAIEVGRRLARLARHCQVFVVTHLAQVASFADQQIVVAKHCDGSVHQTSVTEISQQDRTGELTRMLSGMAETKAGRQHANELLDLARLEREKVAGR